ncbi:MAG TPA: bifunctional aspartate kinase/homoserine dehydrogenase I [Bacteroidales bacterium]|nr:bifunctional aspartate kinase/homoserine dehydrogenase I [Bacteroidales bacterium]
MKVIKFGGSSVSSPERIMNVKGIVESQDDPVIVVVSAFGDTTDKLLNLCHLASTKDHHFFKVYNEIEGMHLDFISALFKEKKAGEVLNKVNSLLKELSNIVNGIYLLGDITPKIQDKVVSFGELLSSLIISELIKDCELLDVRNLVKTNSDFSAAKVNFSVTNRQIKFRFKNFKKASIIPGFIASNERNETTTLGRGGSNYTASIFAAAMDAERLEIWTDVDGFMTADPKKVTKAFAIESLSYAEAIELSHFGADVIYTPTIQPVYQKNIEIIVKNTCNPQAKGTIITKVDSGKPDRLIKGVSSIDDIDLITLQGSGMVGVTDITGRLFNVLSHNNINIVLITQGSSEYSVTFAISPRDSQKAVEKLEKEFEPEIKQRNELNILIEKELSVIAIVGEKMKNTPGISANLFSSLGRNGISAIAIAQGSSELNISVVIRKESLKKALNVIHEGFFLSHIKDLHLYLMGIGTVGSQLLEQIKTQKAKLLQEHKLNINVIGISNSRKMLMVQDGIDLNNYSELLEKQGERADTDLFVQKMRYLNYRNSVFIDCTASERIAATYEDILNSFISVVTANKVACSSSYELYKSLKTAAQDRKVKFMYETNVGAGLPIISTLSDLVRSGDKIIRLEAVLSGTLNFILNVLNTDVKLSKAIQLAQEKGYSEPDPRTDLSGSDVLRKLLILAREAAYPIEKEDVKVNPLLPSELFKGSIDDFWLNLKKHDNEFENRRKQIEARQKKWRYVALLDEGNASIGLQEVDSSHPAYNLEDSNNIIVIQTERYHEQPMVIRGYGAGAEVTAAGVFAEIIKVANL